MSDYKYYNGTNHIFTSDNTNSVTISAGSGQSLLIEGFTPGPFAEAGIGLELVDNSFNVLVDNSTIEVNEDNKLQVKSIPNNKLANSSITINSGSGITAPGTISLGSSGSVSVDNTVIRTTGGQTIIGSLDVTTLNGTTLNGTNGTITTLGSTTAGITTANITTNNTTTLNVTGKATFTNQSVNVPSINFQAGTQADFRITDTNGFLDINVPITTTGSGTNDPTITQITGLTGMQMYTFPGSGGGASMRQCWGIIHIPHNYAPGTGVFFHTHVMTDAAVLTGNYKINFDYTYASSAGVFPAVQTVSVIDNFTSTLQHKISEISAPILASSLEVDGVIMIRMWRDHADAQDTFAGDVHLMFIDAHIQINKFSTKYKDKSTTGSFYG